MIVGNYVAAGLLFCMGLFTVLSRRGLIRIVLGLSLTISPVLELVKWMERKGWLGAIE